MILDEAIKHSEEKYNKLKDTCIECAEEHKQLAEWLKDYKKLKAKEEAENTFNNILYDILGIKQGNEELSNDDLIDILNMEEIPEEIKKEIEHILEQREQEQINCQ